VITAGVRQDFAASPAQTIPRAAPYGITGTMTPSKVSAAYRLGLFFTATAMLVLPLIYVGLIVSVGYGVWWHLSSHAWLLSNPSNIFWRATGYFGPAIAGLTLIFFMVKPILAKPAKRMEPVAISPVHEPVLFQFVNDICREVGAPLPDRIQVDCSVNASASFTAVPIGPQRPALVLTIGLPLAGLTVRQFGGVLAHEFGHFAQSSGMRLTFLVRAINHWFARVVHERDEWDDKLKEWSEEGRNGAAQATMALALLSVLLSRVVLSLLMAAGHAISCFMLRQMEYAADSCEVRLVGSRAFVSTFDRLQELTVGAQIGYGHVHAGWLRHTLPADLPAFFLECARRAPREPLPSTAGEAATDKTGVFDTHPCNADRIRAADRAGEPGILDGGEAPASCLFATLGTISIAATRHHYEHNLGLPLSEATLMDTATALATIDRRDENQRAASTFFEDGVSVLRPIRVAVPSPDAPENRLETWSQARAGMATMRAMIREQYRRYESLQRSRDLAATALAFIESGYSKLAPQRFELSEATATVAEEALARAIEQQQELEPALTRFEAAVSIRLGYVLTLTDATAVSMGPVSLTAPNSGPDLRAEAALLVQPLAVLADVWPDLVEMHHVTCILLTVAPATAAYNENPQARSVTLGRLESRLVKHWRSIRAAIQHVPAGGASTRPLSETLGIDTDTVADPMRAAAVLKRAQTLRSDLIARLAAIAVQVEQIADASQDGTRGDPS
jgi:Zn-dependent protease with chaperone function